LILCYFTTEKEVSVRRKKTAAEMKADHKGYGMDTSFLKKPIRKGMTDPKKKPTKGRKKKT